MPDVPQEPVQTDREWLREQLQRVRADAARERETAQQVRRRAQQVRADNATIRDVDSDAKR